MGIGAVLARQTPEAKSQKEKKPGWAGKRAGLGRSDEDRGKQLALQLAELGQNVHKATRLLLLLSFLQASPASREALLGVKSTFFSPQFPTHSGPSKGETKQKKERKKRGF